MTYEDDYCQFDFGELGIKRITCKDVGVDWPPPTCISVQIMDGKKLMRTIDFECINHSQITDEQRAGMTHVCRGAEYVRAEYVRQAEQLVRENPRAAESLARISEALERTPQRRRRHDWSKR